jgi:hypothetical protein
MLKQHSIDSSTASIDFRIFVERKVVTALCVGGRTCFLFFCEEPRSKIPKGKMKFEPMPDIPVIAGDGITYGVACLQFLDSSLEV